jgi:uncharacterized damage-inducible protein DinB
MTSKAHGKMNVVECHIHVYQFNRTRTLALLDQIAQMPEPRNVLGWRPGAGRAHIAWQLMHIGVTEEIFASERLAKKAGAFTELWPRFRGGSKPDDDVPSPEQIRGVLDEGRSHLLETLGELREDQLDEIPPNWKERGLPLLTVLRLIAWHEAHHQGQAHNTLNSYKAAEKISG